MRDEQPDDAPIHIDEYTYTEKWSCMIQSMVDTNIKFEYHNDWVKSASFATVRIYMIHLGDC